MQLITGSRQNGKTTKLIQKAHETNSIIVCPNLRRRELVSKMAKKLKINIIQPITIDTLMKCPSISGFNYMFDDLFDCLIHILPAGNYTCATVNIEQEKKIPSIDNNYFYILFMTWISCTFLFEFHTTVKLSIIQWIYLCLAVGFLYPLINYALNSKE